MISSVVDNDNFLVLMISSPVYDSVANMTKNRLKQTTVCTLYKVHTLITMFTRI